MRAGRFPAEREMGSVSFEDPTYNAAVAAREAFDAGVKANDEKLNVETAKMAEKRDAGFRAVDDLHAIARDQVSQQATKDERAIRDAHDTEATRLRDVYNKALRDAAEQQASSVLTGGGSK